MESLRLPFLPRDNSILPILATIFLSDSRRVGRVIDWEVAVRRLELNREYDQSLLDHSSHSFDWRRCKLPLVWYTLALQYMMSKRREELYVLLDSDDDYHLKTPQRLSVSSRCVMMTTGHTLRETRKPVHLGFRSSHGRSEQGRLDGKNGNVVICRRR